MPAGQRLPEHDADRPDVGSRFARLAVQPLGRHVGQRPRHVAGRGELLLVRELRETEVEQADRDLLALRDQDVRGLHVAVDDPAPVRVRERLEHLRRRLDRVRVVQVAGPKRLSHRLPRDVLVGDVDVARVPLERVGAQAALVPESRGRKRLPLRARGRLALARDDLQRDLEPGPLVAREPDRPRTAASERPQGPVALGHELTGGKRKGRLGHDLSVFAPPGRILVALLAGIGQLLYGRA